MNNSVVFVSVTCALLVQLAFGAGLRHGRQPGNKRRCTGPRSLVEVDSALVPGGPAGSGLGARGGVVADGFSRVACENDIAPESQRISFKEHACGKGLKSCRLTELGMTPRLCFDFCRQYENAKFFGLHAGRDCYCSVYYHAQTTGGGECNAVCEGDKKEMCGGMEKSSLFEMHMCADSESEAETAAGNSKKAVDASDALVATGKKTVSKLASLVNAWKLGVCSIAPEGQRVCELPQLWTGTSNKITGVSSELTHDTKVLKTKTKTLADNVAALKKAGKKADAKTMSSVELATADVNDAAATVQGGVEMMKNAVKVINGPVVEAPLKSWAEVFKPLGDVKGDWSAICALVPVPGGSYAALAKDDAAPCAAKCLSLSTGTESCAAFNYQYRDGLATCQLLTASGVVESDDAISASVPIFEVSKTKRDKMGIKSMGCHAHGRFTAGHPKGPLGTKVIKEIIVK